MPKETREAVNWLADLGIQSFVVFKDGVQVQDFGSFIDEAAAAPEAIRGINKLGVEAKEITLEDIKSIFDPIGPRLVAEGVNPILAEAIVSQLKSPYCIFAYIKQTQPSQDTASDVAEGESLSGDQSE